jgi:hypothetical protein
MGNKDINRARTTEDRRCKYPRQPKRHYATQILSFWFWLSLSRFPLPSFSRIPRKYRQRNRVQYSTMITSSVRAYELLSLYVTSRLSHPFNHLNTPGCPSQAPLVALSRIFISHSRGSPSTSNVNPFGHATALLALYVDNVRITPASTPNTVFLGLIPALPVVIFFFSFPLIKGRQFKEWLSGTLAGRGVCGTMLNSGVSVPKVTEVVNVARRKEGASSERMDRGISPLKYVSTAQTLRFHRVRTLSIQNPPLRSIIWKKSSYSLLRNQLKRAISKLDQK